MASVMARPTTAAVTSSTIGHGQRTPRKKTSFFSLRKSKERAAAAAADAYASDPSPPLHLPSYFDAVPKPISSLNPRQHKYKGREREKGPPSFSRTDSSSHEGPPKKLSLDSAVAFPSLDLIEPLHDVVFHSHSTNAVSSHHIAAPLGSSNSSIRTQAESPPQSPVDSSSSTSSLDIYPSVVAAPVAGVEFMDALVDGMNGIGGDDYRSPSLSNRSRFAIPGHHPLYQPPLPTPPPGVVLGGGKVRGSRSPKLSNSEDEDDYSKPTSTSRSSRRTGHHSSTSRTMRDADADAPPPAATSSSSRMSSSALQSALPRPFLLHKTSQPARPAGSLRPVVNVSPSTPPPLSPIASSPGNVHRSTYVPSNRPVVPSISEIIRTHAPPPSQAPPKPAASSSRPSSPMASSYTRSISHSTVHEEESEPEPLDPDEEAELLSRSSIDSITDEVQRTLRNQRDFSPHLHLNAPPIVNPQSICSDTFSTRSPRSEFAPEPSIYSSSAASIRQPSSPCDNTSFWLAAQTSQPQAIAQYLRSARLTTLLKLTRSPHASLDNPLTVSLSDLGDRSGFPVVVFLGLGCVRHIMGLYDEMAECLGIRLITIDR